MTVGEVVAEGDYVPLGTKQQEKMSLRQVDPQNTTWAKNKEAFGYRMLLKMGWKEGKGLGASEEGVTDYIRVEKKNDFQGIGQENVSDKWTDASKDFGDLLSKLNSIYSTSQDDKTNNDDSDNDSSDNDESNDSNNDSKAKSEKSKKDKTSKKKKKTKDSEENKSDKKKKKEKKSKKTKDEKEQENDDQDKSKKKKKNKSKKGKDKEQTKDEEKTTKDKKRKKSKKTEELEKIQEQANKIKSRLRYHKSMKAKAVANYSKEDLNQIFGIKEDSSSPVATTITTSTDKVASEKDDSNMIYDGTSFVNPKSMDQYFKEKNVLENNKKQKKRKGIPEEDEEKEKKESKRRKSK